MISSSHPRGRESSDDEWKKWLYRSEVASKASAFLACWKRHWIFWEWDSDRFDSMFGFSLRPALRLTFPWLRVLCRKAVLDWLKPLIFIWSHSTVKFDTSNQSLIFCDFTHQLATFTCLLIPLSHASMHASKKFYSGLSTLFLRFFGIKKCVGDKKVISKSYVSPVLPPCNNLKCFWVVPQIRIWHTATRWHTKIYRQSELFLQMSKSIIDQQIEHISHSVLFIKSFFVQ